MNRSKLDPVRKATLRRMLQISHNLGELELATEHAISRQLGRGLPLRWEFPLGISLLLMGLLYSTTSPFLVALLGLIVPSLIWSLLHKLQRGAKPDDTQLRGAKLDWLVLMTRGSTLRVSGLSSIVRVLNREVSLIGLAVDTAPANPQQTRWRLLLTPSGGRPLSLMDVRCSAEEIHRVHALLTERIHQAEQREGEGAAEIPAALRKTQARPLRS